MSVVSLGVVATNAGPSGATIPFVLTSNVPRSDQANGATILVICFNYDQAVGANVVNNITDDTPTDAHYGSRVFADGKNQYAIKTGLTGQVGSGADQGSNAASVTFGLVMNPMSIGDTITLSCAGSPSWSVGQIVALTGVRVDLSGINCNVFPLSSPNAVFGTNQMGLLNSPFARINNGFGIITPIYEALNTGSGSPGATNSLTQFAGGPFPTLIEGELSFPIWQPFNQGPGSGWDVITGFSSWADAITTQLSQLTVNADGNTSAITTGVIGYSPPFAPAVQYQATYTVTGTSGLGGGMVGTVVGFIAGLGPNPKQCGTPNPVFATPIKISPSE